MDSNLSMIRARHLLEQKYVPTHQTPLAVYAPEGTALGVQIHGNYFRITRPEEAEALDCAGVVVTEESALMSTALMQYAAAIGKGFDFAWSDGFFSPEATVLNVPFTGASAAVMSKTLFLRAARESSAAGDILRRGASMAQNRKHLPWALVRFPRPLQTGDVFFPGRKRALLLSHDYTMTGAPLVLVSMVPVLRDAGYDVAVLGPAWDGAAEQFAAAGAAVMTCKEQLEDPALLQLAMSCDLVVANTVVASDAVQKLSGAPVRVLWWLHDARFGYPFIAHRIPQALGSNVRIVAVGEIARSAMHAYRPDFSIGQLLYGLPDLTLEPRADRDFSKEGKLLFVQVGTVEHRKGQDILVKAIRALTPAQLKKAHFLFVGNPAFPDIYRDIQLLIRQYPESVSHIPSLTREEIKALMHQCDCVVCPSRDDPMPTFVTEGAMFGKPVIVSEYTGTASLIRQGENGFIYRRNSPAALTGLLKAVIRRPETLAQMAPACRALYEEHFTQEAFRNAVRDILKTL